MPAWWYVPLPEFYNYYNGPQIAGLSRANRWSHMSREDMEYKYPSTNQYVRTARALKRTLYYGGPAFLAYGQRKITDYWQQKRSRQQQDAPAKRRRLEQLSGPPAVAAERRIGVGGGGVGGSGTLSSSRSLDKGQRSFDKMPWHRKRGQYTRRANCALRESAPRTYCINNAYRMGAPSSNGYQTLCWGGVINDFYFNRTASNWLDAQNNALINRHQANTRQYITKRRLVCKIQNSMNCPVYATPFYFRMKNDMFDTDYATPVTGGNWHDSSNVLMQYLFQILAANQDTVFQAANLVFTAAGGAQSPAYIAMKNGIPPFPQQLDRSVGFTKGRTFKLDVQESKTVSYTSRRIKRVWNADYTSHIVSSGATQNRQATLHRGLTFGIIWLLHGDLMYDTSNVTDVTDGVFEVFASMKAYCTYKIVDHTSNAFAINDLRGTIAPGSENLIVNEEMKAEVPEEDPS